MATLLISGFAWTIPIVLPSTFSRQRTLLKKPRRAAGNAAADRQPAAIDPSILEPPIKGRLAFRSDRQGN